MTFLMRCIVMEIKIILHWVGLILDFNLRVLSIKEEIGIAEIVRYFLLRGTLISRIIFPTILESYLYNRIYRIRSHTLNYGGRVI